VKTIKTVDCIGGINGHKPTDPVSTDMQGLHFTMCRMLLDEGVPYINGIFLFVPESLIEELAWLKDYVSVHEYVDQGSAVDFEFGRAAGIRLIMAKDYGVCGRTDAYEHLGTKYPEGPIYELTCVAVKPSRFKFDGVFKKRMFSSGPTVKIRMTPSV